MVSSRKDDNPQSHRKPPATREGIQNRLIALAHDEAERQILGGTASSQIITQLLKMGTAREELEIEKLKQETNLASAKVVAMESAARAEELFEKAMDAFRGYQPSMDDDIE
jgi:hypothetical protein